MKITQKAFTGSGKLLKGGLHCHTTRSDGKGTPEEVAENPKSYTGHYIKRELVFKKSEKI